MASNALQEMWMYSGTDAGSNRADEISRSAVLEQLEKIVANSHFCHSKRYPSFLRFVVEETLAGHTDVLKERNLGTEVFGRQSDYDTNADPIVRVTAGEIRKRLAQYYHEPGHEHELRIELPLGSYVPHFAPPAHRRQAADASVALEAASAPLPLEQDASVVPSAPSSPVVLFPAAEIPASTPWRRWPLLIAFSAVGLCVLAIGLYLSFFSRASFHDAGTKFFWQPIVSSSNPALVIIGVHSMDSKGRTLPVDTVGSSEQKEPQNMMSLMSRYEMVPISDIVGYSKITNLLTRHARTYQTEGSGEATLDQLRHGPVILIGGLDNVWTIRLTASLRYRFFAKTELLNGIEDSKDPSKLWMFDNALPAHGNARDYAIVASYFDTTIEQQVVIAAGVGRSGTVAATEFITSTANLNAWLKQAKLSPGQNVELVLATDLLDGEPGPPHVIASSTW
ncbi:hypothetical protein [Terriglobus saanensis]|nr:hypothetical protein [Terriglobus saanensis]